MKSYLKRMKKCISEKFRNLKNKGGVPSVIFWILIMALPIYSIYFIAEMVEPLKDFGASFVLWFPKQSILMKSFVIALGLVGSYKIMRFFVKKFSKIYNSKNKYMTKVREFLSERSEFTKKTILLISAILVISISVGAVLGLNSANKVPPVAATIEGPRVPDASYFNANNEQQEENKEEKQEEQSGEKDQESEKATVQNDNTSSENSEAVYYQANNNSTSDSNNQQPENTITAPESNSSNANSGSEIDHSQADNSLIKDDKVENVEEENSNADVEITEPEFVPEEIAPETDNNGQSALPNDEVLPSPEQSDFEQPVVTLSGESRVKVGQSFTLSATTSDNVGVTSFNLDSSSIIGLNGNVELQNVSVNANNASITLKAVSEGTCKISIAPKTAIDAAGNSSAKSNLVNIIIESAEEEPEISNPEDNQQEQPAVPEISNPEDNQQEQPAVPEISNPEQPAVPEISNPDNSQVEQPEQPVEQDTTPAQPEAGNGDVSSDNVEFE